VAVLQAAAGPFPAMAFAARLERLRGRLEEAGCDALLVTGRANVAYLTGFFGSAGMLLVRADSALFVTDGRYRVEAEEDLAEAGVEAQLAVGNAAAQAEALARAAQGCGRIGLEAAHVSWARTRELAEEAFAGVELVPTEGLVEGLRRVKDEGELARMQAAAAVADAALAEVKPMLLARPTEAEFALELDATMRRLGASRPAFETIVASGPNAAMPHARPTARRVGKGELVVVDFGAVVAGYCSDTTRTFSVGEPASARLAAAVEVVAASQKAGTAAVRAGAAAAAVDAACREAIAAVGLGDAFVHATGHGIGLEVHEAPAVGPTSTDSLEASSVITVEPGVYLPGEGGVRIEDTVVVTAAGCRALTGSPKDLVVEDLIVE
jgi:Xaa-Pro aminopeptidase